MAVTYITRDGTKIDGTTGQDHLLEVIYGHALTRMRSAHFVSGSFWDICGKFLSTRLSRRIIPSFVKRITLILAFMKSRNLIPIMHFLQGRSRRSKDRLMNRKIF